MSKIILFIFLGYWFPTNFFLLLFGKNRMNHICQNYQNCQIYQNQIYWLYRQCHQHSVSIILICEVLAFFNSNCFKQYHSNVYDDDDDAFFPIWHFGQILILKISPFFLIFSLIAPTIRPSYHLISWPFYRVWYSY